MAAERDSLEALIASGVLHLVIVVALVFGVTLRDDAAPIAGNIVEAHVVENFSVEPLPMLTPEPDEPEPQPEPEPDDSAQIAAEEAAREAEEMARREAEAQERAKQAEAKRLAEEAERERVAEAERLRLDEARRKAAEQAEKEQAEAAEARRKAAAEEAERKERERQAALERAREAQDARRRQEAEAELQAALAAEEQRRNAVDAGLLAQYKLKIKQKIQRNWSPPALSGPVNCVLRVRQLITGDVAEIERVDCGGNSALERSLAAAASKASPFPEPDDASLFDPILVFEFRSEE